ncbi:MAG: sugar porter family MFS transporter [Cyclobacteriaceae bacterium]|nr:sugar porter family MFS transporter [Cyclobacteriaceae bacterium]MDH5247858.1 sugar porter family MFS transporter [Cyclobacteriaceae bacterium]
MSGTKYNYTYIWLISLVAAMGGFLFGYDWVVVGGAKPFYEPYFEITSPSAKGWGTSSALIGCVVGALLCFVKSDAWGRKPLLILSGFLFTLSAIGTGLADDFFWYNTMRILGGIAIGIALNLSPMYISEMAPPHLRGRLVSLNQLLIMIGVLSAQVMNWQITLYDKQIPQIVTDEIIRQSWTGQNGWRWMFGVEAVPAFLFFLIMIFMPESARWLMKNGQPDKAEKILAKIGGSDYANAEIMAIQETLSIDEVSQVHFRDLFEKKLFKVLLLGIFLAIFQQWCGMNVVFYYAADIFQAAGYTLQQMMLNIVVIGTVMVISVIVTMLIIEKIGRKKLMLIGSLSLSIGYGLIGSLFFFRITGLPVVLLTLANVAIYSITLAPLVWVILSEIFPNRIRGAAMSAAAMALWVGNFSLTFSFPAIKENLGWANNFWLYGAICAFGFIVLFFTLPETKGKTLEQIEAALVD